MQWFGEHVLHPTLCIKPFVLLLIRCPHGTVLLVMVGLDHMAVSMDVDVAAGVESQKYAPMSNGSARSAVLGTGGVVRIADTVRVSRTTMRIPHRPQHRRKLLSWRRRWLVWRTTNPFWLAQEFLEKELEKLQRKPNGPKKTAKHIEAKQNWIDGECTRLESESAKLAEWQESLRVIKILRENLLREGEQMDKNKSHIMSPESTEEIRILESSSNKNWLSGGDRLRRGWLGGHGTVQRRKSLAG